MKKTLITLILMVIAIWPVTPCTTFIISGKYTPDGRPILYKHRDTGTLDNALAYFNDGKYNYLGIVNATSDWNKEVWGGFNSAGFAIINSVAYNKNIGNKTDFADQEGIIMKMALQSCATLSDFEEMLNRLPRPLGVDTNFGVIDAEGGAAYYETGNDGFVKVDANDPLIAPYGYLIRTNHAGSGPIDKGAGYIRFATTNNALYRLAAKNDFSTSSLLNNVSRNLTHSLTGVDLTDKLPADNETPYYRFFEDFVPRYSSASVMMIRGSAKGDNPLNTMMWSIVGNPLCTPAVPVWLKTKEQQPKVLTMKAGHHAPVCDRSLILKKEIFPVDRGSGHKYINLAALANRQGNGILQLVRSVEKTIIDKTIQMSQQNKDADIKKNTIIEFYNWVDKFISDTYINMTWPGNELQLLNEND